MAYSVTSSIETSPNSPSQSTRYILANATLTLVLPPTQRQSPVPVLASPSWYDLGQGPG
jgi:hypothetical protein